MMNEEMLQRTDTGYAPWTIIEATDKNYAAMKILAAVTDRLQYEVDRREMEKQNPAAEAVASSAPFAEKRFKNGVLSGVDLTKRKLTKRSWTDCRSGWNHCTVSFTVCGFLWSLVLKAGMLPEKAEQLSG